MKVKLVLASGALAASALPVIPSPAAAEPTPERCGPGLRSAVFDFDDYLAARKAALSGQRVQLP